MSFPGFFKKLWDTFGAYGDGQVGYPESRYQSRIQNNAGRISLRGGFLTLGADVILVEEEEFNEAPNVSWRVNDETIATINENTGRLTAVSNGRVSVMAFLGNTHYHVSDVVEIIVENQGVFDINIEGEEQINLPGEIVDLTARIRENQNNRNELVLAWEVNEENTIALIEREHSGDIGIRPLRNGEVTLTATFNDPTILPNPIEETHTITISNNGVFSINLMAVGSFENKNQTITATILEDENIREEGISVNWEVIEGNDLINRNEVNNRKIGLERLNSGIVKIKGHITGLDNLRGNLASNEIELIIPTQYKAAINEVDRAIVIKEGKLVVEADIIAEGNDLGDEVPVAYWSVDDPSIASINVNTGELQAIKNGTVQVTALPGNGNYHLPGSAAVIIKNQGNFVVGIVGQNAITDNNGTLELTPSIHEDDVVRVLDEFTIEWEVTEGNERVTTVENDHKLTLTAVQNGVVKVKVKLTDPGISGSLEFIKTINITNQVASITGMAIAGTNADQLQVGRKYKLRVTFDKPWSMENNPAIEALDIVGIKVLKSKWKDAKKTYSVSFLVLKGGLDTTVTCLEETLVVKSLVGNPTLYNEPLNAEDFDGFELMRKLSAGLDSLYIAFGEEYPSDTENQRLTFSVRGAEELFKMLDLKWSTSDPNRCAFVRKTGDNLRAAIFEVKAANTSFDLIASMSFQGEKYSISKEIEIRSLNEGEYAVGGQIVHDTAEDQVVALGEDLLLHLEATFTISGNTQQLILPIKSQFKGATIKSIVANTLELENLESLSTVTICLTSNGVYQALGDNDRIGGILDVSDASECFVKLNIGSTNLFTAKQAPDVNPNQLPKYEALNGKLLRIIVANDRLNTWRWEDKVNFNAGVGKQLGAGERTLFKLYGIDEPTIHGIHSYVFSFDDTKYSLNVKLMEPPVEDDEDQEDESDFTSDMTLPVVNRKGWDYTFVIKKELLNTFLSYRNVKKADVKAISWSPQSGKGEWNVVKPRAGNDGFELKIKNIKTDRWKRPFPGGTAGAVTITFRENDFFNEK